MKRAAIASILAAAALTLAACAARSPAPSTLVSLERLEQSVTPGRSTAQQVQAALGPATVVRFDSGYQAWCYFYPPAQAAPPGPDGETQYAEFVILFGPDGVVAKTRRHEPSAAL